jgi:flagellar protein FliS
MGGAPVMDNSQSVYAGLTYGRGSLNENLVGNANRGFLV